MGNLKLERKHEMCGKTIDLTTTFFLTDYKNDSVGIDNFFVLENVTINLSVLTTINNTNSMRF